MARCSLSQLVQSRDDDDRLRVAIATIVRSAVVRRDDGHARRRDREVRLLPDVDRK